jgi:hypothetical protein
MVVQDFSTFGEALTNKLVSEIAAAKGPSYDWLRRADHVNARSVKWVSLAP